MAIADFGVIDMWLTFSRSFFKLLLRACQNCMLAPRRLGSRGLKQESRILTFMVFVNALLYVAHLLTRGKQSRSK
jgi:hypothetical protein